MRPASSLPRKRGRSNPRPFSCKLRAMAKTQPFDAAFATLKGVLAPHAGKLAVLADTPKEFTLVSKGPSPFPQHRGKPMYFASVRLGKAYVSFHLITLYMNPKMSKLISPALKKRMQGKACFNFKVEPEPTTLAELKRLTKIGYKEGKQKKWL
jgi:hypothetical protein